MPWPVGFLLSWLISVLPCRGGWGTDGPALARTWEDIRKILTAAEDDSWEPLPPRFPKLSFKLLLDALIPDATHLNHFAVNLGAADGREHDPVFPLFEDGYAGIAVEADPSLYDALSANLASVNKSNAVFIVIEKVQPPTLKALLERYKAPSDFDCLKIDIDSIDLPVLESILQSGYVPKVLMLEVNPDIPPPFQFHLECLVSL